MKDFDTTAVRELRGFESGHTDRAGDATPEMLDNASFGRTPTRREYLNAIKVKNATEHIRVIPAAGVSLHCVCKGNFPLFDLISATLRIIDPATITDLHLCTLGFSAKNMQDLFAMLDDGSVGRVRVLCSCYFRSLSAEIFNPMAEGLEGRGQRIIAMRTHAKLILARTTAGHHLTVESSANLRSCRNVEQFTLTNDAGLYEFHAGWMQKLFGEDSSGR